MYRPGRGKIEESSPEMDGKLLSRIDIDQHGKDKRKVTIKVHERSTGEVVFIAEYFTTESERPAYFTAEDIVKEYAKTNGYYLDMKLTNVELPYVGMSRKRTR
ncbi:MAG TPA: hypothetical protein VNM69_00480 [Bacillus sp. (in: firmicutes)]|uniref:hypothetical protein n=1 Tax=Bacillus litorisediminis TaxID=2922713 RepID=UPI001FAF09CA|nr:hypothetical protein [Bacillus litorisediminis]HWO74371.1 hypothetical protein [Bacillus sp. (in: firmicutes)]